MGVVCCRDGSRWLLRSGFVFFLVFFWEERELFRWAGHWFGGVAVWLFDFRLVAGAIGEGVVDGFGCGRDGWTSRAWSSKRLSWFKLRNPNPATGA